MMIMIKSFYMQNLLKEKKSNEYFFKIMPIDIIIISRLEPPYERNGRVTPVTGISPTTTLKLSID